MLAVSSVILLLSWVSFVSCTLRDSGRFLGRKLLNGSDKFFFQRKSDVTNVVVSCVLNDESCNKNVKEVFSCLVLSQTKCS